jgi:hypothetical protein
MKFDTYYESMMNQLEFDFRDIPEWAKKLESNWDNKFSKKYFSIKNMEIGSRRNAAFRKFWKSVIEILKGKGLSNSRLIDLGIPEYMFNLYN